jgi:lactate dehydrogenase-like 2-hydroxyacid dehydrogenase
MSVFTQVADELDAVAAGGARLIALRSAGYNNVDLVTAAKVGLTVLRVPAYSPHAVAEHAVALMLTLNRNIHRAYNRVRDGAWAQSGLVENTVGRWLAVGFAIGAVVCSLPASLLAGVSPPITRC